MFRLLAFLVAVSTVPVSFASAPAVGEVAVIVSEDGAGVADVRLSLNGAPVATTNAGGAASFAAGSGRHRLVAERGATLLGFLEFRLDSNEAADIVIGAAKIAGEPAIDIQTYDVGATDDVDLSAYVVDSAGFAVAGATVVVDEINASTQTDETGLFALTVPRGLYDVRVEHPTEGSGKFTAVRASPLFGGGFQLPLTRPSTDVAAPAESPGAEDSAAEESSVTVGPDGVQEVVVVARYVRRDTATEIKRSAEFVLDAISATEIAIAGDSSASDALQRVTGVTIKDDFVFVRGLGDRYSATLVNGVELPSPDPSRRVLALDLFPTELIGGIEVQKTYTPDLPGDFSGGVVKLQTRRVPSSFEASLGASFGGNSRSTGNSGYTYEGGNRDFLGVDDGSRDMPSVASSLTNRGRIPLSQLSQADREAVAESLPGDYDKRLLTLPPDFGLEFSVGNRYSGFDFAEVGVQLAAILNNNWRYRDESRTRLQSTGEGGAFVQEATKLERTEQAVDSGVVLSLVSDFNDSNSVQFTSLLTRQTQDGTYYETGFQRYSDVFEFQTTTLEWIETDLFMNQLIGTHGLDALIAGSTLSWDLTLAKAQRDLPDRRSYTYGRPIGSDVTPFLGPGSSPLAVEHQWQYLEEDSNDIGAAFELPYSFGDLFRGDLTLGARVGSRERDFDTVRFAFNVFGLDLLQRTLPSLEGVLVPAAISGAANTPPAGEVILVNSTFTAPGIPNSDRYTGELDQTAYFLATDSYLGKGEAWRLQLGFRYEDYDLGVSSFDNTGQSVGVGGLDEGNFLPAASLTWSLSEQRQIRAGLSKTVNRPQFRELSPVQFIDPETRFTTFGNPELETADVLNFDLRYEWYWSGNEGMTFAVFYKDFDKPIEVVTRPTSGNRPFLTFENAESATDFGVELDLRVAFDEYESVAPWLAYSYVATNLSLIDSEAKLDPNELGGSTNAKRKLQGQSPWIANLTLGYSNPGSETDIALLFNMYGERIVEAGYEGLDDALEKPAPTLDLNIGQRLFKSWRVGFKVRNLLDPDFEVEQEGIPQRRFKRGTSASLSAKYEF